MKFVRQPDGRLKRTDVKTTIMVPKLMSAEDRAAIEAINGMQMPEPVAEEIIAACDAMREAHRRVAAVVALLIERGDHEEAENIEQQAQDVFFPHGLGGSLEMLR
jgi:hypothetical protein